MKKYIFFNTEPQANILGLNPIINAFWDKRIEKLAGYRSSSFIYEIQDEIMRAGLLKKEWDKMGQTFFRRFSIDRSFSERLKRQLEKNGRKLYQLSKNTLKRKEQKLLSEADKKRAIIQILNLYTTICIPGLVGPIIEFNLGGMTEKIKEILKKRDLSKLGFQVAECLPLLTYSKRIIWTDKSRTALNKLAAGIYARREKLVALSHQSLTKINNYVQTWGWLYYGYTGPEYSFQNCLEEIKIIYDKKINPIKQILQLQRERLVNIREQKMLLSKLKLNAQEKYLIQTAQDFVYTKAYRTNLMSLACYTVNRLLIYFAKKENYSLNQLGVCTVREISAYFRDQKKLPSAAILNKRQKYSLLISKERSDLVLVGSAAISWVKNNVIREKIDPNLKELSGTVVCTGKKQKLSGLTRTVTSSKDLFKVGKGDILISTTTIPDYVPAMRRAAAIVTETGGLTCHAAIVSRELNKPCLVGVKHLLQIFKDGAQAELDLEKGTIRKI